LTVTSNLGVGTVTDKLPGAKPGAVAVMVALPGASALIVTEGDAVLPAAIVVIAGTLATPGDPLESVTVVIAATGVGAFTVTLPLLPTNMVCEGGMKLSGGAFTVKSRVSLPDA